MSYDSLLKKMYSMQHNTQNLPRVMHARAENLASLSHVPNTSVVVNNTPRGAQVVFKPVVGATTNTEKTAKYAKALSKKLNKDSQELVRAALK
jgi:hypothetical protein